MVHEIMNKFKDIKGKQAYIALKLDMKKAYDRLEWDFIFSYLKDMGFHDRWVSWIHECVTINSYSIKVNDEVCGSTL